VNITNIVKKFHNGWETPNHLVEFTLKLKQGKFVKNNSSEIVFTPYNYLTSTPQKDLKIDYRTYDCNNQKIQDKKFETFTLTRSSRLAKDESIIKAELKVPFKCEEYFYTATLNKKITSTAKVLKSYRGMGQSLKSTEEDVLKFYIYVDVANGKVVQHMIEDESYRKIHKERYKLNMQSCQYKIEVKNTQIQKKGARPLLHSDDMGWGIEDETNFYVKLPFSEKRISFNWKKLKEQGRIYAKKAYSHDPFKVSKEIGSKYGLNNLLKLRKKEMKKQAKNSADYIDKAKGNRFQSFTSPHAPSRDIQCGIDVSMESLMLRPIDGTLPKQISVKVKIRKSTKAEIAIMKASMK
jgi:hypothetical protein